MKNLSYIKLPNETLRQILPKLNNSEAGLLLNAVFAFAVGNEIPEMPIQVDVCFSILRSQIDEDRARYQCRCQKNSDNVSKRWQRAAEVQQEKSECHPADNTKKKHNPSCTNAEYDWVDLKFYEPFRTWCEYRRKARKPFASETYVRKNYEYLVQLSGGDPDMAAAIVQNSIVNSYQALVAPKQQNNNGPITKYERHRMSEQQLGQALAEQCLRELTSEDNRESERVPFRISEGK